MVQRDNFERELIPTEGLRSDEVEMVLVEEPMVSAGSPKVLRGSSALKAAAIPGMVALLLNCRERSSIPAFDILMD